MWLEERRKRAVENSYLEEEDSRARARARNCRGRRPVRRPVDDDPVSQRRSSSAAGES